MKTFIPILFLFLPPTYRPRMHIMPPYKMNYKTRMGFPSDSSFLSLSLLSKQLTAGQPSAAYLIFTHYLPSHSD